MQEYSDNSDSFGKEIIYFCIFIICIFAVFLPASERSTEIDYGKLISRHKDAEAEYGDKYNVILAISTVNHDNDDLDDNFPITESVSYLRCLSKKKYRLEQYEECHTNSKGEEKCVTRTRKILLSVDEYKGEELINFSKNKFRISRSKLLRYGKYKKLLKFEWIFPDEQPKPDILITYSLERLDETDIVYDDYDKNVWYAFLASEGVFALYDEKILEEIVANSGKSSDTSDVNTPIDPNKENIVEFAKQFLGVPYRWGSPSGWTKSFDCSSFTQYIYKKCYGADIPRVSQSQYDSLQHINKQDLQTGDLVFFYTGFGNTQNKITHVGMYIGDGKFIHASSSKGVTISDMNTEKRKKQYRGAGRLK